MTKSPEILHHRLATRARDVSSKCAIERSQLQRIAEPVAAVMMGVGLLHCGSDQITYIDGASASNQPSDGEGDSLGSLDMELRFGAQLTVNTVRWRIEGNGLNKSGDIAVGQKPLISALLGGIPVGEGYRLWITSTDRAMNCSGTATFSIWPASITTLRVDVMCFPTATTGQLAVTAPFNVCPVVTDLSAIPLQLEVGETARLWTAAEDLDQGPRGLRVRWEADRPGFTSDRLEASYTCQSIGPTVVQVIANDGSCDGRASLVLQCAEPQVPRSAWPGAPEVRTLEPRGTFGPNLSGATYAPGVTAASGALWVVQNSPSKLIPLYPQAGGAVALGPDGPWRNGRSLRYPNGSGDPDAEGVTFAAGSDAVYVATERDNSSSSSSRLSVLRFALNSEAGDLVASHEWNVTAQLPPVGANAGLEAITWVPDTYLVSNGLIDERTQTLYQPNDSVHAGGLFLVGVEATGVIHAFALNHETRETSRVATFPSGHPGVMGLEFDRDTGQLWAACDDGCQGEMTVLRIDTDRTSATFGRFQVVKAVRPPMDMPNINNEGIAFVPESECVGGVKQMYWVDDNNTGGFSVRGAFMPCGVLR
jgi:hypothetical protein